MALILRVDVDKPYGNTNILRRILSKFSEDVYTFSWRSLNYLSHLEVFVGYCNAHKIQGYFYHRLCTTPSDNVLKQYQYGGHKIGLHAENTKSFDTFQYEIVTLEKSVGHKIESFTKHGSGELKLGKYHYAPYEPEIYHEWAKEANCGFYFGNEIANTASDVKPENNFFKSMFWVEQDYRNEGFHSIEEVIELAKTTDVPVLIHPCNFVSSKQAKADFMKIVELAKKENVSWILPF